LGASLAKYCMNEFELAQLARTIRNSLPVAASEMPCFRGFYAADNRAPDWEQRLAAIVAELGQYRGYVL